MTRIDSFRRRMRKEGLDGFLTLHQPNRNYLSHFTGTSGALVFGASKTLFLTDSRYTVQAAKQVQGAQVIQHTRPLLKDAAVQVRKLGIRKLGLETLHLSHAAYEFLKKELPKVSLKPTRNLVELGRMVKEEGEKARMRQAARITDLAFHKLLGRIRPGVRESELAAELEHFMRVEGASGPSFDSIVASGWRSALPHGVASAKKVEKGDFIVFDFGCVYDGYCSDMTRTVILGRPTALQRRVYETVRRAQAAGLAKVKAGVKAGDVDKAARSVIARAGWAGKFGHGLGHGVGVEVHEEPRLGPGSKQVLEPGMAVTVEPGVYLEGKFGVRIEDLVLVARDGCENLYRTSKQLMVL